VLPPARGARETLDDERPLAGGAEVLQETQSRRRQRKNAGGIFYTLLSIIAAMIDGPEIDRG
jgi:hypothetical protein